MITHLAFTPDGEERPVQTVPLPDRITVPPMPMPADVAAWIYDNVIASYHWEDWPNTPANERNPECDPSHIGQAPPLYEGVCYCVRRMCTLVGPGRIRRNWSDGYPFRHYPVWLAHARDPLRLADHARQQEEAAEDIEVDVPAAPPTPPPVPAAPEPEPVPMAGGVQLDIFAEVIG